MRRCPWCGGQFRAAAGSGRPQLYCRRSHRQRAFEARLQAGEVGLADNEALISRVDLVAVQDAIFAIQSALDDVDSDLAEGGKVGEAFTHLYRAAEEWRSLTIEPRATPRKRP